MSETATLLARLRERLYAENLTCIVQKDDRTMISRQRGIRPLLDLIRQGTDLDGACAADRIVGKAAALLYVKMGARGVFAEVLSESGLATLKNHGVYAEYATLTPRVQSRDGTGLCPMEQTVLEIDDPSAAYTALVRKAEQLRTGKQ